MGTNLEELNKLGFTLTTSCASEVKAWGKWLVYLKAESGRTVAGYGDNEEAALADALATASRVKDEPQAKAH